MTLKETLAQAGQVSPLALGGTYAGIMIVLEVLLGLAPESVLVALLSLLVWVVASVGFYVIVTWFRDDDWLMSGFLLAVSSILSVVIAIAVTGAIREGSVAPIITAAPSAFLAVIVRGLILIPLAGGAVALGRWLTTTRIPAGRPRRPAKTSTP